MGTVLVILIVFFLLIFIWRRLKFAKRATANPITTITYGSCMGIRIGDEEKFVISRLNHLGIKIKEVKDSFIISSHSIIADGGFNNISLLKFLTVCNHLMEVSIEIKPEQANLDTMKSALSNILITHLGNPKNVTENRVEWENNGHTVVMDKNTIIDGIEITIG